MGRPAELPATFGVRLARRTRRSPDGRTLLGGRPLRILRLRSTGAALVDAWESGAPVGDASGARRLAARLVQGALADPVPPEHDPRAPVPAAVTVVVPVRDEAAGLDATLAALEGSGVGAVVVVDDASRQAIDPVAGVHVLRHRTNRGPAAARNTGWRRADSELVWFLDAGCVPASGALERMLAHLADPAVVAVAPRVRAGARAGWLAELEAVRFPLDMGVDPSAVGPGSGVAYVPTASLLVRRSALEAVGGFDAALRYGEDVDLVWRIVAGAGDCGVRYDPGAVVEHPPRAEVRAALIQRFRYGTSAAALARRHPASLAALHVSRSDAASWALVCAGRPLVALGLAFGAARRPFSRTREAVGGADAVRVIAESRLRTAEATAGALRRSWWPLLAAASLRSSRARRLACATLVPLGVEWAVERPRLGLGAWVLARVAEDAAYGAGVWWGCVVERTVGPLRAVLHRS